MTQMRVAAVVAGILLLVAACKSGGDGQTKSDSRKSQSDKERARQTSTSDEGGELLSHPEPAEDRNRIDPGDVPAVGSKLELSKKEWRERLTEKEFHILRENGTEPAHSGELLDEKRKGVYYCAGCGAPVFSSKHKFESNTGWPSYTRPYDPKRLGLKADKSLGMMRTEVHCARCGGHLGHVFDDGPQPTGLRYCINSLALDFKSVDEIQSAADETGGSADAGTSSETAE